MTSANIAMLNSALVVAAWGMLWGFLCSAALYGMVLLLRRYAPLESEE